ncbi:MAG: hypothetical protein MUP24_03575 [Gillisia sp.]|nr:hypothetical protein [Gillisia sp.]
MKNQLKFKTVFLVFLSVFFLTSGFSQEVEKAKVRLKADYVKVMGGEVYFNLNASARVNGDNIKVPDLDLTIYNEVGDEKIKLGEAKTDVNGDGKLVLEGLNSIKPDSTNTYNVSISFKGNDSFKRASKSLSFRDAAIEAKLFTEDSINYISATLIDKSTDSVVVGSLLRVQVQRLFKPLKIGEEYNITDDNGTVVVSIPEGIPGEDGNLIIEVVLNATDAFGTVKALVQAPVGSVKVVDESTFEQRTLWSPRDKTPLFMLIFPNLLILGIWGIIIYLFINLFKIAKS